MNEFTKTIQTKDIFSLMACPGSGKTVASIKAAKWLMEHGIVQRLVVCAHNDEICKQWRRTGTRLDLDLYCGWRTDHGDQTDYKGFIVTYQSLATNVEGHRERCARHRTLLIVDEAHHIGEELPWNDHVNRAFEQVKKILVVSGTPFRHDGRLPAFIDHTRDPETGELMRNVDFKYSYRQAVEDGVCREVYFPHFDGKAEWRSRFGDEKEALISDNVPRHLESERNRAALDAHGDWIATVFTEANAKLTECREAGHAQAGGLILAYNIAEARKFAETLKRMTGEQATVVVSEERGADEKIERFRRSSDRWVIAVKMINEGVDISRLRVLVYATICQTELHFLQAMGRIARAGDDPEDDKYLAYAFLPHRKEFLAFADRMRKERDDAVDEIIRRNHERKLPSNDDASSDDNDSLFMPLGSSAISMGVFGPQGNSTPDELAYAREYKTQHGLKYSPEIIAEILRPTRGTPAATATATEAPPKKQTDRQDEAKRLRAEIKEIVGRLVKGRLDGPSYEWYHIEWQKMGGSKQAIAGLEELRRKRAWLLTL